MKKRIILIVLIIALSLVAMMSVVACGMSGTTTTTSTSVTLNSVDISRKSILNEFETFDGDLFCLSVTDEVCETVLVTINLTNTNAYSISYVVINGERILKTAFRSDSTTSVINIEYTPDYQDYLDNIVDYDTQYEYEISVTEIAVAVGLVSEYVSIGSKGTNTVNISPTFRVDLDFGLAEQYFDDTIYTNYIDIVYGYTLQEASGIITEYNMEKTNDSEDSVGMCASGYVFMGWYTEPEGGGTLIEYTDQFLYSSITKLYAHYDIQFVYEVISEEDGTAKITGLTASGKSQTALALPSEIEGYTIIEVGTSALTTSGASYITFADTITTVGNYACRGLTAYITLTDSITTVGDYAFENCTRLVVNSALNNVEYIGTYAFAGCVWDTVYGARTYSDTLYLNENLTYLGDYCFYNSGFKSVMVDANIAILAENMGSYIFQYSASLANFYSAVELAEGASYLSVASYGGLTTIPAYCFQYCYALKTYATTSAGLIMSTGGVSGVYLAEGLTSISASAFSGLNKNSSAQLTTITLPDSLVSIGENAFNNSGLTDIIFTGGSATESQLATIGDYAFAQCNFTTLYLYTNNLSSVGKAVFEFNTDMISLYLYATNVPSFSSANSGISQYTNDYLKIYVQDSLISAYEDEWVTGGTSVWGTGGVAFNFISLSKIITIDKATYAYEVIDEDSKTARIVSAFQTGTSTAITIPATIDGYTITEIGGAFAFVALTSATITYPANITEICDSAFIDTALKTFDFSGLTNLESIGKYAFENTNITSFISASSALTSIGVDAFYSCKSLEKVVLITTGSDLWIDDNAFKYSGVETVVLGPNVRYVDTGAFSYCENLTSVYIQAEKVFGGSLTATLVFTGTPLTNMTMYFASYKIMQTFMSDKYYGALECEYVEGTYVG
ncbi:MAG: leucine-rich repeat domain-containing protein [Bacillota bacterium]